MKKLLPRLSLAELRAECVRMELVQDNDEELARMRKAELARLLKDYLLACVHLSLHLNGSRPKSLTFLVTDVEQIGSQACIDLGLVTVHKPSFLCNQVQLAEPTFAFMFMAKILANIVGCENLYEGGEDLMSMLFDLCQNVKRTEDDSLSIRLAESEESSSMETDMPGPSKRMKRNKKEPVLIKLGNWEPFKSREWLGSKFFFRTLAKTPEKTETNWIGTGILNEPLPTGDEAKVGRIELVAVLQYICFFMDTYPHWDEEDGTKHQRWSKIIQGMGRLSDTCNRMETLLYFKEVSIWGALKAKGAMRWLCWRGSKLSKAAAVKFCKSLDIGNLIKAAAIQKGQLRRKSSDEAKRELAEIVKELCSRLIHPAQIYVAKQILSSDTIEPQTIQLLINSLLVVKPKMSAVIQVPLCMWEPSMTSTWKGQYIQYNKSIDRIKTRYPSVLLVHFLCAAFEDMGVLDNMVQGKVRYRCELEKTTIRYANQPGISRELYSPLKIINTFPPMKGSPSSLMKNAEQFSTGVSMKIERVSQDRLNTHILLSGDYYADLKHAKEELLRIIGAFEPGQLEATGSREAWTGDLFETPVALRPTTMGKSFFSESD